MALLQNPGNNTSEQEVAGMFEFKRIFVPVEFSDKSSTGVELAVLLAEKTGSVIHMIHSVGKNKKYSDKKFFNNKISYTTKIIDRFINYYTRRTNGLVHFDFSIVTEDTLQSVIKRANETLGAAVSIGLRENFGFFFRNSPQKTISSSTKPVFSIQGKVLPAAIKNIVLPLDNSPETNIKVPFTAVIAKMFDARVHILLLNTSDEAKKTINLYSQQINSFFFEQGITTKNVQIKGSSLIDMVLNYTENIGGDMISAVAQPEKSLYNLLQSNYTSQLISKSPVPVMLIPSNYPYKMNGFKNNL